MKGLKLYFISDPKVHDPGGALATEAEIIKDHILVKSMDDLIQRTIQICVKKKALVKVMTLSSHGNSYIFDVGSNYFGTGDPRLQSLSVLTPFFAKGGYLIINACEVGNNQELLKQIAKILGVSVIAYTGDIDVWKWFVFEGVEPQGNKVVCTATGCTEIDPVERLRQAFWGGGVP